MCAYLGAKGELNKKKIMRNRKENACQRDKTHVKTYAYVSCIYRYIWTNNTHEKKNDNKEYNNGLAQVYDALNISSDHFKMYTYI